VLDDELSTGIVDVLSPYSSISGYCTNVYGSVVFAGRVKAQTTS